MLSANVIKLLNDQMNLEFYSSNLYLQMSAWCEQNGFEGAAKFLSEHAAEEMQHIRFGYVYLVHLTSLVKPRPPAAVDELIQVKGVLLFIGLSRVLVIGMLFQIVFGRKERGQAPQL